MNIRSGVRDADFEKRRQGHFYKLIFAGPSKTGFFQVRCTKNIREKRVKNSCMKIIPSAVWVRKLRYLRCSIPLSSDIQAIRWTNPSSSNNGISVQKRTANTSSTTRPKLPKKSRLWHTCQRAQLGHMWPNHFHSYDGGGAANGSFLNVKQVKDEGRDKRYRGPPAWGLGVGFTTPPR